MSDVNGNIVFPCRSFARLMSRNETVMKAKLLMQQSLSLGAPNPKLVKMIEILIDHFSMWSGNLHFLRYFYVFLILVEHTFLPASFVKDALYSCDLQVFF